MKTKELFRVLKFMFFSISAGLIEMGVFALLNELSEWPYWPSYLIALTVSVLWNFTLNRRFTFQSYANIPKAMSLVFGYYLVFTPLSTIFGNWLVEDMFWNEYVVTSINMVMNFVTEYLFQRYVIYAKTVDERLN